MARRKSNKIQPSVESLTFIPRDTVPTASAGPGVVPGQFTYYVDLSQCASLMNRRFYRQGIQWAVSNIRLSTTAVQGGVPYPASQAGKITISKLPQTWVMSNAWEKAFRAWQHMIKNATDESGTASIKGKFLDFKIFADSTHHNKGFGANILPVDSDTNEANPGQWQASDVTLPTVGTGVAVDYELIAVGANDPGPGASGKDAKSLIQGYADSRALPYEEDPNVPAAANQNWLMKMFNDGTNQDSAVINMLETTGDEAPYPYENDGTNVATMYPGGENNLQALQIHSRELMTGTTVGNQTYLKGGTFPCGLLKIEIENYDGTYEMQPEIVIDLVPGSHRGYLCEPMTEM